jgi:hypothetical protein
VTARPKLVLALGLALALPATASAQPKAKPRPAAPAQASQKPLRPEELKGEGNLDRPKASALTPPSVTLPVERERRESMLPKILQAVDRDPL